MHALAFEGANESGNAAEVIFGAYLPLVPTIILFLYFVYHEVVTRPDKSILSLIKGRNLWDHIQVNEHYRPRPRA